MGARRAGLFYVMPGSLIPVLEEKKPFEGQPEYALLLSWHIGDVGFFNSAAVLRRVHHRFNASRTRRTNPSTVNGFSTNGRPRSIPGLCATDSG